MAVVLYDSLGRPIERTRRPSARQVAVASVYDRWSTYPSRGLTPGKLARILQEADEGDVGQQAELFQEMEEKDAHLASIMGTRKMAVIGRPRRVLPAGDGADEKKAADLVEEALGRLDVENLLLDLLDGLGKGYSVSEIHWDIGKRILPRAVEWVDARRFRWEGQALRLLTDEAPQGIPLPANKFIVHLYKARSGAPARAGLFRTCAWWYLFKNFSVKDWMAFAEVFAIPLRVGKYDPGASKEDKEALEQALHDLGSDAAALISKATEIEFVTFKGNAGGEVFDRLAAFCERAMSKAVLGQTLTTDTTGTTGTYSAGRVHDEVRHDLMKADALAVAKTLQRDLVLPIVGFNLGWDRTQRLPRIEFDTREAEDLEALSKTYGTLVRDVGLPIGADHVRQRFGIPAPQDGEELVGGLVAGTLKAGTPARVLTRGPERAGPDQLADNSIDQAADGMDDLVDPLMRMVEEAANLDDLRDRILEAYPDMDPAGMEDLLARAMYMAELGGMADA